jgi:undecaprenyl-diphosphatase
MAAAQKMSIEDPIQPMHNTAVINPSKDVGLAKDRPNLLSTPGLLAKRPAIGLLMTLFGFAWFAAIVISLENNGALIQADVPVNNAIHALALHSSAIIVDLMILGFYVGEQAIMVIGVLLGLYYIYKRFWQELLMIGITWSGEALIWRFLSQYFSRPRPVFDVPIWNTMTVPSFPSGHMMATVMCYGYFTYILAPKIKPWLGKVLVILGGCLIILYIGYSRIFLGHHYLSDVLAGFALGVGWSALIYTSVELIYKKRNQRNVQEK